MGQGGPARISAPPAMPSLVLATVPALAPVPYPTAVPHMASAPLTQLRYAGEPNMAPR